MLEGLVKEKNQSITEKLNPSKASHYQAPSKGKYRLQLKRLKIKGFKSFADPTTIEFDQGVTAVVGPNGSGKSNVIEAIRWVMGEQSAKSLRGGRMDDIIFSGTDQRKPMNIAQVTLTLDNSTGFLPIDYQEVSISRRLNRNGQSDYQINQQDCRLKDIVDLFLDSGLGKESFSIISQGEVESIFNAKPEDRRAIFEEAAGVFKYKVQKKEAGRKLEDTQGNLDRVEDILHELKSQIDPLKDQADQAQKYKDLKAQLKKTDVGLSVMQIKTYAQDLDQAKKDYQILKQKIKNLNQSLEENSQVQDQLKADQDQLSQKRDQVYNEIVDLVQAIESRESDLALQAERAKHKQDFVQEKTKSIEANQADLEEVKQKLKAKAQDRVQVQESIDQVTQDLNAKRDRLGLLQEDSDDRLEDLRADYIDLMQAKASLNNEDQSLNQDLAKIGMQSARQEKAQADLQAKLESSQADLKEKEEELDQVSQELNDLLDRFQQIDSDRKQFKDRYQGAEDRLRHLKQDYDRAKAQYTSLAQMQKSYSGYYSGVKKVMQNQGRLQGIIGTVADLITIPNQYLTAIDTSLGSSSQFIVVEDEASGRAAIDYLKQNKAGRATFLPLTTIKGRQVQAKLLQEAQTQPGYIGLASDLVTYDQKLTQIVHNLLGTTLLAQDLKSANQIAKAIHYRHRVVSLDGNMMNAGGSMTGGGNRSQQSPIFSQKEQIDQLQGKLKSLQPKIHDQEKQLQDLKAQNDRSQDDLEEIRSQGEAKRYRENNLKNAIAHLTDSIKSLQDQVKAGQFDLEERDREAQEAKDRLQAISQEKDQVLTQLEAINQEMEDLNTAKADSSKQEDQILGEIDRLSNDLGQKRENLASIKANLEGLKDQEDRFLTVIDDLKADIKSFQEEEVSQASRESLAAELKDLKADHEAKKDQEAQLKKREADLADQVQNLADQIKDQQDQIQDLTQAKNKNEVSQSRLEVNLDHQLNYLVEEYGVSFEEASQKPDLDMDVDQAKDQVKSLKTATSNLGPVNLNAIEEYQQVAQRYDFLAQQQADLIEAKSELHQTMKEMDQEVKSRFKAMFDQIKDRFAQVFPQLFGGGRAELRLTDPDDLLNTGVDIIAQPPGKSLSSLSLLSGGERALTAISLLFTIIQVSPVPFCILDEAEAALDESNVNRFGRYLQEFETDTQFIVITHRRGTMEEADRLYGITMQEKGVSKLISVRLSDVDQDGDWEEAR